MYERILVPTDDSAGAMAAAELAVDLASQYDATIHVLFVVDTTSLPADVTATYVDEALEEVGERATRGVVELADEAGVETAPVEIASGAPHREILAYADEHDVDLIVMGTHGRRGLDRLLVGSVTEKVVRLSDVPVLTTRAPKEETE
ncbi:universal stress protein [Halomarina pelagica]|uniref:universal stress protein n=1 Tax=Halomarina pelagica TaxID=2961599 RepID=UPI0020C28F84|nr:universal stress protein [Halomarina sp. BND7]